MSWLLTYDPYDKVATIIGHFETIEAAETLLRTEPIESVGFSEGRLFELTEGSVRFDRWVDFKTEPDEVDYRDVATRS